MKWVLRIVAVLVVLVVIGGGVLWWVSRPADPGDFYATPDALPKGPGKVIDSEDFTRSVPPGAEAHLIKYTTTDETGAQHVATATVLVPTAKADGPRPVLAWAHGTTGVVPGCAPSLLKDPWAGIPAVDQLVEAGYVVVATDYVGLGTEGPHQYLVGRTAARNVLDGIRALHDYDEQDDVTDGAGLTDEAVVWGHSQGGQTTLFTGEVAEDYAPDVKLAGLGALAPPADLSALLGAEKDTIVGKVLSSMAMRSWSETFDDVDFDQVVRKGARTAARGISSRCLTKPGAYLTLVEGESLKTSIFDGDPTKDPVLVAHMDDNSASGPIATPLFIGQGAADDVVDPTVTEDYVATMCKDPAQDLDFYLLPKITHFTIVEKGSPIEEPLLQWTADRFAGKPVEPGCQTHDG
jgi:pimeloyl-ACP methyl ester carboxylesterase